MDNNTNVMTAFHQSAHLWGRITMGLGILISFALPLYLSYVMGYHPGYDLILKSFLAYAAVIGFVWVLEPVMYFAILGVSGTYIAFFTGNISNMCLPSAAASQEALKVEPGTEKGEIVGTLGISAASLVNKIILIPIILLGLWLLTVIPESIQEVFPYVLPAIFGAVLAQFSLKYPMYGVLALIVGALVNISPTPLILKNLVVIIIVVALAFQLEKRKK